MTASSDACIGVAVLLRPFVPRVRDARILVSPREPLESASSCERRRALPVGRSRRPASGTEIDRRRVEHRKRVRAALESSRECVDLSAGSPFTAQHRVPRRRVAPRAGSSEVRDGVDEHGPVRRDGEDGVRSPSPAVRPRSSPAAASRLRGPTTAAPTVGAGGRAPLGGPRPRPGSVRARGRSPLAKCAPGTGLAGDRPRLGASASPRHFALRVIARHRPRGALPRSPAPRRSPRGRPP
jgi:hypothetical protein